MRLICIVSVSVASFLSKDRLSIPQKDFGNMNRLIEKSARIVSKIKHQGCHSFRVQAFQRVDEFIGGGVIKAAAHVDIADRRFQHVEVWNGRLRHSIANDLDFFEALVGGSFQGQVYCRASRAANLVAHFERALARHLHTVDLDYSITKPKTRPCCWRSIERSGYESICLITVGIILN